jgi:hypothetical protein
LSTPRSAKQPKFFNILANIYFGMRIWVILLLLSHSDWTIQSLGSRHEQDLYSIWNEWWRMGLRGTAYGEKWDYENRISFENHINHEWQMGTGDIIMPNGHE